MLIDRRDTLFLTHLLKARTGILFVLQFAIENNHF